MDHKCSKSEDEMALEHEFELLFNKETIDSLFEEEERFVSLNSIDVD